MNATEKKEVGDLIERLQSDLDGLGSQDSPMMYVRRRDVAILLNALRNVCNENMLLEPKGD